MSGPQADALALEARELVAGYEPGLPLVRGASLAVRPGEVVGLGGLDGQGQRELLLAFFGVLRGLSGKILVDGREVSIGSPASSQALRPMLIACSPNCCTQPATTSSTSAGSIPARSITSL